MLEIRNLAQELGITTYKSGGGVADCVGIVYVFRISPTHRIHRSSNPKALLERALSRFRVNVKVIFWDQPIEEGPSLVGISFDGHYSAAHKIGETLSDLFKDDSLRPGKSRLHMVWKKSTEIKNESKL